MGSSSQDNRRSLALPFSSSRQPIHLPPAQNPVSPRSSLPFCLRSCSSQPAVSVQIPPSLTQHYLFGWCWGEPLFPTDSRIWDRTVCSVPRGLGNREVAAISRRICLTTPGTRHLLRLTESCRLNAKPAAAGSYSPAISADTTLTRVPDPQPDHGLFPAPLPPRAKIFNPFVSPPNPPVFYTAAERRGGPAGRARPRGDGDAGTGAPRCAPPAAPMRARGTCGAPPAGAAGLEAAGAPSPRSVPGVPRSLHHPPLPKEAPRWGSRPPRTCLPAPA